MSCSCTGVVISARSGRRRTFAVRPSWSACSQAGTTEVSSVASRTTGSTGAFGRIVITSSSRNWYEGMFTRLPLITQCPCKIIWRAGSRRSRGGRARCRSATRAAATGSRRSRRTGGWPWRSSCGTASRARRSTGAPSASHAAGRGTPTAANGRGRDRPAGTDAARRRTCQSGSARPSRTASCPRGGTACTEAPYHAPSDTPPLAGPAAVVRLRGHVLDRGDLKPGRLERADRGLAARARSLDEYLDLLKSVLHALARRGVGGHLRRERSGLARALEARSAGGLPRDHVAVLVGQRHDRVVETRLDVGLTEGHVLPDAPAATTWASRLGHSPAASLPSAS